MKCVTGRDLPEIIESEEQAIFETLEMWYWLKENPDKWKNGYLIDLIWNCGCALCEFYSMDCHKCFGRYSWLCTIGNKCAFYKWLNGIDKKRNATIIYDTTKKYYFEKFGKVHEVKQNGN